MIDYRNLPAVEPVKVPSRFSQTLMAKADDCPRSAYLYVKHRGGAGGHNLDRGSLGHAVWERALKELIVRRERSFSPEEPEQAAAIMAAFVDEVLRENPGLVVPRREVDDVREMSYHWAVGYDVNPEDVAGVERLMVLDLECGLTISGKLDVIVFPSAELGQVDDYKSGPNVLTQEEYDGKVQPWIYAALLCFGVVVDVYPCDFCGGTGVCYEDHGGGATETLGCQDCEGKGRIEIRGEQIGGHLRGVLTREVYPRPKLRDDGTLHRREMLLSRTAIADFVADLERDAATLAKRFETWDFPARSSGGPGNGSWCSECPASAECPLPGALRNHAGTINSVAEAEEAWALAQHVKAHTAAVEKEVKSFAKAHAVDIRVGDQVWRWEPREGRSVKRRGRGSDWEGLESAVVESVEFGTPFDVGQWLVSTVSNSFVKSKVTEERAA